jgi:hypothetical protein
MQRTFWGTVRQGKIELLDSADLVEGTQVLVTLIANDESEFWRQTSQVSLNAVWDNAEDDIYAELLKKMRSFWFAIRFQTYQVQRSDLRLW